MTDLLSTRCLYLDLELQCWAAPTPEGFTNDIIQIGIVEVDLLTLKIRREAGYYVRPMKMEISTFCTHLTGITELILRKQGHSLSDVLARIAKKFGPLHKQCLTWGDDLAPLQRECDLRKKPVPFNMLDLGWVYRSSFGLKHGVSLPAALNAFGLQFEGRPHDALVDARNTARVHMAMVERMRQSPIFLLDGNSGPDNR